jgi:SAM-dependent methyltransferase
MVLTIGSNKVNGGCEMNPDWSSRPCPLCGSTDESRVFAWTNLDVALLDEHAFGSRKLPEYMHHRLILCPVCDLLYASPVPPVDHLISAYRHAAFDSKEEARFASRTYGRLLRNLLGHLPDLSGALDIGTGEGSFLEELLAAGFIDVQGVEPSAAPIASSSPYIRHLIRDTVFRVQDFQPSHFSLITCFQTIEHMYDPLGICHDVMKLLKPGGVLFIIGHNWRAFSTRFFGRRSPILDIEHLQLLSPTSILYMIEKAGFINAGLKRIVNCYPLHYWIKLSPIASVLKLRFISVLKALKIGFVPLCLPVGNLAAIAFKPDGLVLDSPAK